MPMLKMKCLKCNNTFEQNYERCDNQDSGDDCNGLCEQFFDENILMVDKAKIEEVIEYANTWEMNRIADTVLIKMLENLKKG